MTWVLAALLLLWLAFGPLVLVLTAALMAVPRLRWWVQDNWAPSRRALKVVGGVALALVAVPVVLPDGWLPLPPAPGVLAAPSYVGRPAAASPVTVAPVPQHPWLAAEGRDAAHDARAGHASPWAGPLGLQPEVETAWWGWEHCPRPAFDSRDRLVVACDGRDGPAVHVVDAGSMHKLASRDLPDGPDDGPASDAACDATPSYLDERDRVVLATADRHVLALRTADGRGDAELSVDQEWDLRPYVPHGDCLVALLPDRSGRLWWASRGGLLGTVAPDTAEVRVHDLGEGVAGSLAIDETGGVYVASTEALHRLAAGADGTPQPTWRVPHHHDADPQAPIALAGATPALLDGGVLAVAASAKGSAEVVFLDRASGAEVCRQPVFEDDDASAGGTLVSLGTGVVVSDRHGYDGPRSALLGFASSPGVARVDLDGRECRVRWTSDVVSPSAVATASLANGLVYTYTKRPTWSGVSAWYLTALDATSGRAMWRARAGTGALLNDDHAAPAIGPDGSLWTGTLGGLVRVRDRQ